MAKGLQLFGRWLRRALDLFILERRRLRGHLVAVCNFLVRGRGETSTDLIFLVTSDKARGWSCVRRVLCGYQGKVLLQKMVGH